MGFYTPGIAVDIKKTAKRNCAGAEYFGLNGDYPAGQGQPTVFSETMKFYFTDKERILWMSFKRFLMGLP